MARPREFNEREALDKAMNVFWAKGYQGATPQDLLKAMGLSKSSFYATFASKHDLFLRCIKHYNEMGLRFFAGLLSQDNARSAIEHMYEQMIDIAMSANGRRGCMLVNCATELSPHDPQVEALVKDGLSKLEQTLYKTILRGQKRGHIAAKHNPHTLAKYLLSSNSGFQVMAKARPNRKALRDVVSVVLSALD